MDFSKLDRYITIQQATLTQDEVNEALPTWAPFVSCFAQRSSRPGREFIEAGRTVSESRVYFIIRHQDGITAQMRILDGNQTFEILDVRYSDKRGDSIQLDCREIV